MSRIRSGGFAKRITMFKKVLLRADLTPSQAEILEYLYQNKEAKASEIAKKIKRSRAIVYKEVEELANIGVIERIDAPNKVSVFRANHPSQLQKLLDSRENKLKKDRELLNNYLPDMISGYNLTHNKPGVRFFEGMDGIKKVLWDTLSSQEAIMAYSDIEAIDKYANKLNKEYVEKRKKLGVKKRGIVKDSPFSRNFLKNYFTDITENRFISGELFPFNTLLQIYDNKIAYATLSKESMIGVIIEDKNIYQLHKSLFENTWQNAKTLDQLEEEGGLSNAK